ncbi:uncharacterized protein LOC119604269, partial [Lucilia sericata]|uniref:uncharacterized protein LOC119604269 n=1 Tax=Lucilia sericata TaxID=13632 RepID=UPI0018A81208
IEHRTCPMCKLDVLKFYGYVFIGSEESILEYPAETTPADAAANSSVNSSNVRPTGALADLIRSRDFVIDFPRVFVLEGGSETRRRSSIFNEGLPERSQSSMGLAQAKDWMCTVANKLEEQHGLRRARKNSQRMEMQENLLSVRQESMKMRRSRSTEGRYCVRREAETPEAKSNNNELEVEGACGVSNGQSTSNSSSTSRRNSNSNPLSHLQPVVSLKFDILNKRRKSITTRRASDVSLKPLVQNEKEGEAEVEVEAAQPIAVEDNLPSITIEIVDENNQ